MLENDVKDLLISILTIPAPQKFSTKSLCFLNKYLQNPNSIQDIQKFKSLSLNDFISNSNKLTITQIDNSNLIIDELNSIISINDLTQSDLSKISLLIFNFLIDWISIYENKIFKFSSEKTSIPFPGRPLMTSLLFIIEKSTEFKNKAVTFFRLFFLYISIKQSSLPIFSSFDSSQLFISTWKNVFHLSNESINCYSLQELFNLVFQLQSENKNFLVNDDAHELFHLLKPLISNSFCNPENIDIEALYRFKILSAQLSTKEIDLECQELIDSFIKYISTIEPIIHFNNIDEFDFNDDNSFIIDLFSCNKLFQLISTKVMTISRLLISIFNHSSHELCQFFQIYIKSLTINDDQLLSILITLAFICSQATFESYSISQFCSYVVCETILFNNSNSIFSKQFDENLLILKFYFFKCFLIATPDICLQILWDRYQNDVVHIAEMIFFFSLMTKFDFSDSFHLTLFKQSYMKFNSQNNFNLIQFSMLKYFENEFNPNRQKQLFMDNDFIHVMFDINQFTNVNLVKHIQILIQIIEMAKNRIQRHRKETFNYSLLVNESSKCCKCIALNENLKKENLLNVSQQYLYALIPFIGIVDFDEQIDFNVNDLYQLITLIEGDEPSSACFLSLMLAASRCSITSLRPEFLVSNPEFIILTLHCFSKSSRLPGFLQFFNTLCSFSTSNCRSCHIGGLDIELLDLVKKTKNNGVINEAFKLFQTIANVASSTAVVIKFISCFHPTCGKRRASPLMSIALKTLDSIFSSGISFPEAYLPVMNEYPTIRVNNLNSKEIQNGFTFLAWVFIDMGSQTSPANLFMLSKEMEKEPFLTIFIHTKHIFIYTVDNTEHTEILIPDEIPLERWTMIAITFSCVDKSSRKYSIVSFINNKANSIAQTLKLNLKNQTIQCSVCGYIDGGNKLEHPAFLSSASLFPPLNTVTCLEISQSGLFLTNMHNEFEQLPKPLFSVVINSENSILSIKKLGKFDIKLDGKITVQLMPFTKIFIKFFTAKTLIPIFALLSLKPENELENDKQALATSAISVILHSLQLSPYSSYEQFVDFGGFSLIAFLLSFVPECLTETFSPQICTILQGLQYKSIRIDACDCLIYNEYLLSLASIEAQKNIVKQWQINIKKPYFKSNKEFKDFLYTTLYLFWIKQENQSVQNELVQFFIEKAKMMKELTKTDFAYLINATKYNQSICLSMLDALTEIIQTQSDIDETDFLPLNSLLFNCDETVIYKLSIFFTILYKNRTNPTFSLSQHFFLMAKEIRSPVLVHDICKFAELTNQNPELISICFAIISSIAHDSSLKKEAESLGRILLNLLNSTNFENVYRWTYWPIQAAILIGNTFLSSVVEFINHKTSDFKDSIITSISHSKSFGDTSGNFVRKYLLIIGSEFSLPNIKISQSDISKYIDLCFYFMFYFSPTKPLSSLFDNNLMLQKQFVEINDEFAQHKLSLNINFDGNWKDKDLAKQCVDIICKREMKEYFEFAYFIIPFLYQVFPEETHPIFNQIIVDLDKTKKISSKLQEFVDCLIQSKICTPKIIISVFKLINQRFIMSVNEIQQNSNKIQKTITDLFSSYQNITKEKAYSEIQFDPDTIHCQLKLEKSKWMHKWRSFWQSMTFDCSPWYSSDYETQKKWKRDDVLCTQSLIPMKMKINYKYTDHQEAALFRELGCLKWAQDKITEYKIEEKKRELASEYGPVPQLLKTSSFSDDDENEEEVQKPIQNASTTGMKPQKRIQARLTNSDILSLRFDFAVINSEVQELNLTNVKCTRVRIADHKSHISCLFSLTKSGIELKFEKKMILIPFDNILRVLLRAPLHHPCAIEIFTKTGISYFLVFAEKILNVDIAQAISNAAPSMISRLIQTISSPIIYFHNQGFTESWIKRKMSTFEYLMMLNHFSGRSFSHASMYPLFPWVLSDYTSNTLDLTNPKIFRDLSLTVGQIGQERYQALLQRKKEMETFQDQAFMYSSYAVSPLITFLWLMRVEPFTTLHIDIQSGKFDHAARQFSSIGDTYQMVTGHMNDFRELLPEFFFNKEFLLNSNEFDLGTANGSQIDQVILPPWAHNNPAAFIYYHRKALESEICSQNINKWIDLIWGIKSKTSDNSYDPCLYEDIWTDDNLNDRDKRDFIEATLQNCGQIPNRLFETEHPKRNPITSKQIVSIESLYALIKLDQNEIILFGTIKELEKSRINRNLANIDNNLNNSNAIILSFRMLVITSKGRFLDIYLNQLEIDKKSSELNINAVNSIWKIDFIEDITSFAMFSLDEFAFSNSIGKVQIIQPRRASILTIQHHAGMSNCIAAAAPYIISGGSDTVVACSEKKRINDNEICFDPIFSMPTYTNEVVCVAASKDFHVAVSGTMGGFLIVQSLEKGKMTNYIDLKENRKPSQIIVTRGWGFIVVYTTRKSESNQNLKNKVIHEILIFTLLGNLLGQRQIDSRITRLITFTSYDGFDFVITALDNGVIAAFEAFYVSVDFLIIASSQKIGDNERLLPPNFGLENNEIVLMSYSIEKGNLLVISKRGQIVLLPNVFFPTDRILKI